MSKRYQFKHLILALMSVFASSVAKAQLKESMMLGETIPLSAQREAPSYLFGDNITTRPDLEIVIEGDAQWRKSDTVVRADRLEYNQVTDVAKMTGNVLINQNGNRYFGPYLELNLTDFTGVFNAPKFELLKPGTNGDAQRVDFLSERQSVAWAVDYTSCRRPLGPNGEAWKPDWVLKADKIDFDFEQDIATASGATLRFQDIPLFAIPTLSFPMSNERVSGLLPPTIGSDSLSGYTYTQPYYWNIAPNRDATISPTYFSNRGFDTSAEFRYLEPNSMGTLFADYLPKDKVYGATRWGVAIDNRSILKAPDSNFSDINARITIDRVSDNYYWSDFSSTGNPLLTQRLLNNEVNLSSIIDGWVTMARVQRWQTIQTATTPITPPFDRNELSTKRNFDLPQGLKLKVDGDITAFNADPLLTLQPNGSRAVANFELSRPWASRSGFITPKFIFNAADYQLNSPVIGSSVTSQTRYVPTFSLDSGLFFERDTNFFGRDYTQTLEPRIYYVHTPYHDQSMLPNYDSAAKDFSLTTIYTENLFSGNDRISDMDMLTFGATSRFLDPKTGAQLASFGIAQRYSLRDQDVTLPTVPASTTRLNDFLVNASIKLKTWSFDGTVQFPESLGAAQATTLVTRYNPSDYRVFSAAYRQQQGVGSELGALPGVGTNEQLDINWQWPLGDLFGRADENTGSMSAGHGLGPNRWYSVMHLNYSLTDQRMVNAIVGFEYDADCWIGRIVLSRTQLDVNTSDRSLMFQIEFVGFSKVGVSPLSSLRNNIPGYQGLRQQITTPSRFSQYD